MSSSTAGDGARDVTPRRRASLELLRAEAADELSVIVEERLLGGEDPWEFIEELPTIDELVVFTLRAENIAANGGVRPNAARHYRVLRQIALDYPALTPAVWKLLGEANTHRRWDAVVRVDAR
ncbi:tryptophan synthase subunit alpha [Microbacterium protaetiae]|uniref:tryptophan synthase subunit alpha n=1 Tax=Microbacterium protaetiae TaxID=2509458 RepID=UPI0026D53521